MAEVKRKISIHSVAACCNNHGIGKNGDLAWHLPKEYRHFAKLTTGTPPEGKQNAVVMGRKTWFSIPEKYRPLQNRINFVLTRNQSITSLDGVDQVVHSIQELTEVLHSEKWSNKINEIYNVGGSEIYKLIQDSPLCGNIFLTKIMADYDCDTFFPKLDADFKQLPIENFPHVPQGVVKEKGVEWKVEVFSRDVSFIKEATASS